MLQDQAQAVEILNDARQSADPSEKLRLLGQLVELILRKNPTLLEEFAGYFFEFQIDTNSKIRKYVALTIAEMVAGLPPNKMAECGQCLVRLLKDNAGQVAKHALISATSFVQLSFPLVCGKMQASRIRLNEVIFHVTALSLPRPCHPTYIIVRLAFCRRSPEQFGLLLAQSESMSV